MWPTLTLCLARRETRSTLKEVPIGRNQKRQGKLKKQSYSKENDYNIRFKMTVKLFKVSKNDYGNQ